MTDTMQFIRGCNQRRQRSWSHIDLIIWQHSKADFTVGVHYMTTADRQVNLWEFVTKRRYLYVR